MLFRLGGNRSSSKIQKSHIEDIGNNSKKEKFFEEMIHLAVKMKEVLLRGDVKQFCKLFT